MPAEPTPEARELRRKVHQTIGRVTDDIEERLKLNTAVAALMELYNEIARLEPKVGEGPMRPVLREAIETLVLLLAPFAPHACEEMWMRLGRRFSIVDRNWPVADRELAQQDLVELAVQLNGRVRARITLPAGAGEEQSRERALADPKVRELIAGRQLVKAVVVPGRLVSLVVE
jgi:leucyl-tRNA synthetase